MSKAPLPLAAWVTAGRQKGLARNMKGFLEIFERHRHVLTVLIGADEQGDALAEAVQDAVSASPFPVYLSGLDERAAFLDSLPSDFDRTVIRDAVFRRGNLPFPGANRNAVLLASAGRVLICTDDDIEARPAKTTVDYGSDAYCTVTLPDQDAVHSAVEPVEIDIAGEHLRCLKDRKTCIGSFGFYGRTGSSTNRGILTVAGEVRNAVMSGGYTALRDSSCTVNIPSSFRRTPETVFMSTHASYNASDILPPFYTAGRNEDGLFAHVVRLCKPGSTTAYLEYGLFHNPECPKQYTEATRTSFSLGLAELFMILSARAAHPLESRDPAERMAQIGFELCDYAELSAGDFTDLLYSLAHPSIQAYENHLLALLDEYGREPAQWAEDVDRLLESVRGFQREPTRLYGKEGCGFTIAGTQDELSRYGALLQQWPALWEYAAEMNGGGPCTARSL